MYLFAFLYSVSVLFILVLHTICKNRVENKHEKKHENSMKTGMESSLKTDKNEVLYGSWTLINCTSTCHMCTVSESPMSLKYTRWCPLLISIGQTACFINKWRVETPKASVWGTKYYHFQILKIRKKCTYGMSLLSTLNLSD